MGRIVIGLILFSGIVRAELFYDIIFKNTHLFLLGSIHAGKDSFYPLSNAVETAYLKSDSIFVEVDMDDHHSDSALKALSANLYYPQGKSLSTQTTPQIYDKWIAYALKNHMTPQMYEKFRPWAIVMQIGDWEVKKNGYSAEWGIDRYFINKAREDRKNVVALETLEEQMYLLRDPEYEENLLSFVIEEANDGRFSLDQMYRMWKSGDETKFESMINEEYSVEPKYHQIFDKVILRRNLSMAKKIEQILDAGTNGMVIVGSAHLIGKKGVVNLLREKGYRVLKR